MYSASSTRRSFVAGSIAALVASNAVFSQPSPQAKSNQEHHLICGVPMYEDSNEVYSGIEVFDSNMVSHGAAQMTDGVVSILPTGRPGLAFSTTLFGAMLIDLDRVEPAAIDWETAAPSFVIPAFGSDNGRPLNATWMFASDLELTRVFAINFETRQGLDLTNVLVTSEQDVIPVVADLPANSSIGGVWTGNRVSLVDLSDPSNATPLIGPDDSWFTTTLNINSAGTHATYTAYDPETRSADAEVYLYDISSGEQQKLAEGDAWSTAIFVEGNEESFLVLNQGLIELRSFANAMESGESIGEIGDQPGSVIWNADSTRFLLGHKSSSDETRRWILVDVNTWTAAPIDDLTGKRPSIPAHGNIALDHLLFLEDSVENISHDLVGFTFATGETWPVLTGVYLEGVDPISGSTSGAHYALGTANRGENKGAWLIDMENQSTFRFPDERRTFSERAIIHPNGSQVAVVKVTQPAASRETWVAETSDPESLNLVSENHALAWV